jgi:hypothetical protein
MNVLRGGALFVLTTIVAGCGAAGGTAAKSTQSTPDVWVTSSVYWYTLAPSRGCQLAVAYSRVHSALQPLPELVVQSATLVRSSETLAMDYAAVTIQRQGLDLWATTTACSQADNFAEGERLHVVLRVTLLGVGTFDLQAPDTDLTPSKGPLPRLGGR